MSENHRSKAVKFHLDLEISSQRTMVDIDSTLPGELMPNIGNHDLSLKGHHFNNINDLDELPLCPVCYSVGFKSKVKKSTNTSRGNFLHACYRSKNHATAGYGHRRYIYNKSDQLFLIQLIEDSTRTSCDCSDCTSKPTDLPEKLELRSSSHKLLCGKRLKSTGAGYEYLPSSKDHGSDVAFSTSNYGKWCEKRPCSVKGNSDIKLMKCSYHRASKMFESSSRS